MINVSNMGMLPSSFVITSYSIHYTKLYDSGGRNLDIIPRTAGKGAVIRFLHQWLSIPASQVIVAGDSGNDVDMFVPPFRGISYNFV